MGGISAIIVMDIKDKYVKRLSRNMCETYTLCLTPNLRVDFSIFEPHIEHFALLEAASWAVMSLASVNSFFIFLTCLTSSISSLLVGRPLFLDIISLLFDSPAPFPSSDELQCNKKREEVNDTNEVIYNKYMCM